MLDAFVHRTALEQCLINAAHACLKQHISRLEDIQTKRAIPSDPLEVPTIVLLLRDRVGYARRLLQQMHNRIEALEKDNLEADADFQYIRSTYRSMLLTINEMEILGDQGRDLVKELDGPKVSVFPERHRMLPTLRPYGLIFGAPA